MLSKFNRLITLHKHLLITVIISFLLHVLILTNFSISLSSTTEGQQVIAMNIISQPPEEVLGIQEERILPSIKQPTANQSTPNRNNNVLDEASKDALNRDMPITTTSQTTEDSNNIPVHVETLPEHGNEEQINDQVNTSSIELESIDLPPDTIHHEYIETEFDVSVENNTSIVATTKIIFDMRNAPNYKLTSLTEAKGIGAVIFGKLEQISEGLVTKEGLKPTSYTYKYGSNEKKLQHAKFLWAEEMVEMYSKSGKKVAALPNGTQDLLSFMYQFMFIPPLTNMQIIMTNGKSLQTYTYTFQGEEQIDTKLDKLDTIHLVRDREDEKTEIWLATDYQNLPVKIRKTEKNGYIIVQTISKIYTQAH